MLQDIKISNAVMCLCGYIVCMYSHTYIHAGIYTNAFTFIIRKKIIREKENTRKR